MHIKNTRERYGIVAIILHWYMAILLIGLVILGLYMVRIPISLHKLRMFGLHKSWGIWALLFAFIRYGWRLVNLLPVMPKTMPSLQIVAARLAHYAFYVLMFAIPISGWMISSAAGVPVSLFGWFVLPDLVAPDKALLPMLRMVHQWFSYGLCGLLCVHASAALWHHFVYKDDILKRML